MGIHDLGLHVVQQEPCNDLKPQTAPQSQAMGWETLVARWGPCMQPRRGPTMGEKILAAHQGPRNTMGTAMTPCHLGSLQHTQRTGPGSWHPSLPPPVPSLGPELTRPGPQTGT